MKIAVVIPARNESENIEATVRQVQSDEVKAVVVDGASTDDTVARAKAAGAWSVTESAGPTYGDAVLTGMDLALAMGAECIVVMDVGAHKFADLAQSIYWRTPVQWDVLAGLRYQADKPLVRRLLSKLASKVVRSPIGDTSNGFRAYKAHVARELVEHFGRRMPPSYAFNMAVATYRPMVDGSWRVREFLMSYTHGTSGLTFKETLKVLAWRLGWYR